MFKKLDKLIIKAFIGPFIATFFITLLVLVMQFFWLWIDDFVGKGLDATIILKFIWYQSAVLIPLALPLAILLSSLMTFGNLGETFELVAIKSSGISLLRFMRPLLIVSFVIAGVAFLFSNYIIPRAYLKARTMLQDIAVAKPAFNLKEGVFYDQINGFAIKIGKKEPNDSVIRDVIVYEQAGNLQDNFIVAKSGIMSVSPNKRVLIFNLKDGWRYQERGTESFGKNVNTDYIRLGFKEYKKQFDLSAMQMSWTPDSTNKNNERVYSIKQLGIAIDSIARENKRVRAQSQHAIYATVPFSTFLDSTSTRGKIIRSDSLFKVAKAFTDLIPDSAAESVHQRTSSQISSMKAALETSEATSKERDRILRKHKIEWHKKIVLSLSCVVLFLIGAPLGSIIRKGGLGTPLIFAIIFFMVFYFTTTMGEKLAKENTLSPFSGMWLATFVLVPIGVFLTYKAMHDSQVFNKDKYTKVFNQLLASLGGRKKESRSSQV